MQEKKNNVVESKVGPIALNVLLLLLFNLIENLCAHHCHWTFVMSIKVKYGFNIYANVNWKLWLNFLYITTECKKLLKEMINPIWSRQGKIVYYLSTEIAFNLKSLKRVRHTHWVKCMANFQYHFLLSFCAWDFN